jgi:hypothetical protein
VYTDEQNARIRRALDEKLTGVCPLCAQRAWVIGHGLTMIQAVGPPTEHALDTVTYSYPSLPVMCLACGNTILMNVYVLGISDIWRLESPSPTTPSAPTV